MSVTNLDQEGAVCIIRGGKLSEDQRGNFFVPHDHRYEHGSSVTLVHLKFCRVTDNSVATSLELRDLAEEVRGKLV